MEMQDLTPQERVDGALLSRILGTDCNCDRSGAREQEAMPAMSGYVDARSSGNGCGLCGCAYDEQKHVCGFGVENAVLAAVYLPMQKFEGVYDKETALRRGTMFEALDKPFYGDGREVDCRGREK